MPSDTSFFAASCLLQASANEAIDNPLTPASSVCHLNGIEDASILGHWG